MRAQSFQVRPSFLWVTFFPRTEACHHHAALPSACLALRTRIHKFQIYFLRLFDNNYSVDWREDVGKVVDELPVCCLDPTALYHQLARLVDIINHHRVDIEGFVGQNVPGLELEKNVTLILDLKFNLVPI